MGTKLPKPEEKRMLCDPFGIEIKVVGHEQYWRNPAQIRGHGRSKKRPFQSSVKVSFQR